MDSLAAILEDYLREVAATVLGLAKQGQGAEVLGAVPGRSEVEDSEIGIDRVCDELFISRLQGAGLCVEIYSEHGYHKTGGEQPPRYRAAIDPFDGSGLFRRGLPAEWWSVATIYDLDGAPVAGGAADILRREIYLADAQGVVMVSLEDGQRTPLRPAARTTLDDTTVVAAYLMAPTYLLPWADAMRGLLRRFPGIRVWPNGGSCVYPWIARGLLHAYLMWEEPRSEIDPGLAFARASGYPVFSVGADGSLEPYRFVPGEQAGRVPWFIAACTRELAESIIREIRSGIDSPSTRTRS